MNKDMGQLNAWDLLGWECVMPIVMQSVREEWDFEFPTAKIFENSKGFLLMVVIPGYEEDDLEVFLEENALRISGWHSVSPGGVPIEPLFSRDPEEEEFCKVFRFLVPVREDDWKTRFDDGVLMVWLPKVGVERLEFEEA